MNQTLTFSKDFWSSVYQIKDGTKVVVRTEKDSFWSYDTNVRIGDEDFFFDVKGIFSDSVDIYDAQSHLIGNVDLSTWTSNATINLRDGKTFYFKKTDFFSSEWEVFDDQNILIHFKKDWFSNAGKIDVYKEDEICLAIGIFLISLYQQKQAAAA
ncbi:hypothetical protein VB796_13520 [Arcicella sp. LKC2W]|uniref:hypothetical protein n=1 Tax=Arcicella sp. LKC2W TaxID=2984198 RepID=UPI002B2042F8|nr:hypothetical protein [Arcicella sp. LKC2W]MEA5460070.1 hypothetical protein [Arcicella sp. LKC2W]